MMKLAAANGNMYAQYNIGQWYREGMDVDKDLQVAII
jgi:TPR repeat protein